MNNLSVITITYNEEENIAEAITKIRNTFPYAEIVVVDDGSKD